MTRLHAVPARNGAEEAHELQCLDCYTIFTSEVPPRRATCVSCGSGDVTRW